MKVYSALIIDDELTSVQSLKAMIELFCKNVEVIGHAQTVNSALKHIQSSKPDIVFFDVEIIGGTSFDVLSNITSREFASIFVTAYDQYAIKAIKHDGVDYLLKPILADELIVAIRRAAERINERELSGVNSSLASCPDKICISTTEGKKLIEIDDIVRFESKNNYTLVFLRNSIKILTSKTLKSYESILPTKRFIRCHQSHIVNIRVISELFKSDNKMFLRVDNIKVPVSRSHQSFVHNRLREFSV